MLVDNQNCECGWLLSVEGNCGNPDHNAAALREASEIALTYLEDYTAPHPEWIVERLRKALGPTANEIPRPWRLCDCVWGDGHVQCHCPA